MILDLVDNRLNKKLNINLMSNESILVISNHDYRVIFIKTM